MTYYGIKFPPGHVMIEDPEKIRVVHVCDDTKYDGWRQELVFIYTRDKEGWQGENDENTKTLENTLANLDKVLPDYQASSNLLAVTQGDENCLY